MKKSHSPVEQLQLAIDVLGGQAPTARVLGLGRCAVYQWVKRGQMVPVQYAPLLEQATRDLRQTVPARLLRPDVRWDLVRA